MSAETEEALNFQGLCHFLGRLSKASNAGMKAALADSPKCHFHMLEALLHTIHCHGQDGAISVSDLAREVHQPLPAISRGLRQLEADGLIARETAPDDRRKTLRSLPAMRGRFERLLCLCDGTAGAGTGGSAECPARRTDGRHPSRKRRAYDQEGRTEP